MDQALEDSLLLAEEGPGTSQLNQVVPSHSTVKDMQLEREEAEKNYLQSVPETEFTVVEESDDESFDDFEDALDEFLAQSVEDYLRPSESPLSSTLERVAEEQEAETEPPTSPDLEPTTVKIDRQDAVQTLLDRQRNERALELRRLRFESRQEESRNSLENHFNRRNANYNETHESQSSVEGPLVYRSQNVLNEISNLSSRAMVSGIQSSFRERIERSLQQSVARQGRSTPNTNIPTINVPASVPSPIERNNVPAAPVLPQTHFNSYISSRPAPQPQPFLLARSHDNTVANQTREQIVYEISDLVHSQLVSSTLQSAFRLRLENTVRARLRRSGHDGNQTRQNIMDALNNRVTSNIQRNDFSHLGITSPSNQAADPTENLDSASTIGSGQQQNQQRRTRTVVYQNNPREIHDLKMQLQEMKDMLKLSFELQLDMQRSFKQEISALVAGTFQQGANTSTRLNQSHVHSEGKCIICTESNCDTVLIGCGHMVSCYICSMNLKNKGHNCPVCRAPIKDILRTYKSSLDSTD